MKPLRERIAEKSVEVARAYAGSPEFWADLRTDMEQNNRHPTTTALRKALKSGKPTPEWAADYICDRLETKAKLRRGAYNWSVVGLTIGEALQRVPHHFASRTQELKRYFHVSKIAQMERILTHRRYDREWKRRHIGRPYIGSAYREALRKWSEKTGIKEDTLDSYVYPRRKKKRSPST